MLGVHRLDDPERMGRTVEEVGVAEGDVLRPGGGLLPDVGENHLAGHDPEAPVVHGNDGTVPAKMLAAAARLGESDDPLSSVRELEPGVAVERGRSLRSGTRKSILPRWTALPVPAPCRIVCASGPGSPLRRPVRPGSCRPELVGGRRDSPGERPLASSIAPGVAPSRQSLANATSAGSTSPPSTASEPSSRKYASLTGA